VGRSALGQMIMRIAVWHNLPSGGGKRALYDQVRGLVSRGHYVEAWCPPTADQSYLPLADFIIEHVMPLKPSGSRVWDRALRLPARVKRRLMAMDDHCRACASVISSGGFDILLAHSCMFFRATPIGRFVELPKVLYQHEPYRWLYEAMPQLPWLAPLPSQRSHLNPKWVHEKVRDRRILHNARIQGREEVQNAAAFDRILVNSLFSRESIIRAYGLDAEICYLGTDTARFTDQGRPREHLVLGLGSFTPEKNLRLVIEALALLPTPRPALAWVGNVADNDLLEEMTALAAVRGVSFNPHFRISDDEVIALLNRASAMVYAPRLEPFGLAAVEASACGLPVVAVAEAGVRETVIDGETGLLVQNTPRAIADAVARLLNDTVFARRLGLAARVNAERRWSLDSATDRIEQALFRVSAP
jgi:glycosyltransferase involved in cell wall biosynthesis